MSSSKPKNIYDVVQPIHFCSKLIGLTSFSIRRNKLLKFEGFLTMCNVLSIISSTIFSALVVVKYISATEAWKMNRSYLSEFFESCAMTVVTCNGAIIIFVNWWFFFVRKKFIVILDLINEVDHALWESNIMVNHARHKKFVFIFLACVKAANIIGGCLSFYSANLSEVYAMSCFMTLADFFSIESFILLCSQFMFFMWAVRIRYQHINGFLSHKFLRKPSINEKGSKVAIESRKIDEFSILFDKLVDITEYLSFCYGVPVCFLFLEIL